MRVLIVGAGICGLTLAHALRRRGAEPDIVELAPALEPVGAGIALGLNAQRVLGALGLRERIAARGLEHDSGSIRDASGRLLSRLEPGALADAAYGSFLTIHRGELHQALLEGLDPGRLTLDSTVERLEESERQVEVTLRGGERRSYDLVVGADGIHSRVRELLFGEVPLDYAGYTCWRLVVEGEAEEGVVELWGRGRRVGVVPIGGGKVYGFLVANAPRRAAPPWSDLETMRASFAAFTYPPARRMLHSLGDLSQLIHHDLEELPWLPSWHRGRAILVGDAAHAMTPNMGQGACMAIEDAYVLDQALAEADSIPAALTRYEAERRPRVKWVQDTSRTIGRVGQWSGRFSCWARNLGARWTPARVGNATVRRLIEGAPVRV